MKYLLIGLILCLASCGAEPLSFERVDYLGDEIKIHGFYYHEFPEDNRTRCFVLYRNGIFYNLGFITGNKQIAIDLLQNEENIKQARELQYVWGIFKVEGKMVIIDRWASGDVGGAYPVFHYEGVIMNDSTIVFDDKYYKEMHFYEFSSKPDSTNNFID